MVTFKPLKKRNQMLTSAAYFQLILELVLHLKVLPSDLD